MPRYKAGDGTHGDCFCDGQPLDDVVEIDTDLGFAIVVQRDEKGNLLLDGDKIRRHLVLGKMDFTPTIKP